MDRSHAYISIIPIEDDIIAIKLICIYYFVHGLIRLHLINCLHSMHQAILEVQKKQQQDIKICNCNFIFMVQTENISCMV